MARIRLPSPLHSYTRGQAEFELPAATLRELLDGLEALAPGIVFRFVDEAGQVREHMRIFVDGRMTSDLGQSLRAESDVFIMAALSGG